MITKSKLALVATLVAVSFATPAFAQTFAFSGGESSVHYNGAQSHGNFAPTAQNHRAAVGKNGEGVYDQVPDNQTDQPSAGLAIGGISWH
jgi:hypothetical protein